MRMRAQVPNILQAEPPREKMRNLPERRCKNQPRTRAAICGRGEGNMIKGWIHQNEDMSQERFVTIHGNLLLPDDSQKVYNHSPDGFNWGYGGSGPAQLALAILMRFCKANEALRLHQMFKWDVIAKLPANKEWEIPDSRVISWLEAMQAKGAKT